MTARAFIIAIESYDHLPTLTGINADANQFYDWLVNTKKLRPDSIFGCADKKACPWATTGTTADEITIELARLWRKVLEWTDARDATDELFFYYSGHGFANTKSLAEKPVDHLVASDFKDPVLSGNKCLEFYTIKERLYRSLGPAIKHYYFIDSCRNTRNDVKPTGLSFNPDLSPNGATGPIYWLFSTAEKELAARDSEFAKALINGLKGSGSAARWYKTKYWVRFPTLVEYVDMRIQKNSAQQVASDQEGKGDGLILKVDPVPQYEGKIVIDNAEPTDEFKVSIRPEGGSTETDKFQGQEHTFKRLPGYLEISVTHPSATVVQKDPPLSDEGISFFENLAIHFEKDAATIPPLESVTRSGSRAAEVRLAAFPNDEIHVENLKTGSTEKMSGNFNRKVEPGDYLIKVRQFDKTIGKKRVKIRRGARLKLDLRDPQAEVIIAESSPVRDKCVTVIAQHKDPPLLRLETSLGDLARWDLSLVLSLLGASRIVCAASDFPLLSTLPLADFSRAKEGDSAVFLLAGFEKSEGSFSMGLSDGKSVPWVELSKVEEMGIHQQLISASPGPHLFSIKIPDQPPITYATHCLPNRATLVVFTEDIKGRLRLHQFILPIRTLFGHLDWQVLEFLNSNPLEIVRLMFMAQQQFGRKRPIFGEDDPTKGLDMLLDGKWLDPIMSLIGAFELIRRGILKESPRRLDQMITNLRRYFPGLIDTEAIAKIVGHPSFRMPRGAPLLLESVLAFDVAEEERILPLPSHEVDYSSPWTSWRAMVD
jgi:hypothetical protein